MMKQTTPEIQPGIPSHVDAALYPNDTVAEIQLELEKMR